MDQFEKELSIIELDKIKTINEKKKLINEIKNGLGEEIKKTGGKIIVKKKTIFTDIMEKIFKLF